MYSWSIKTILAAAPTNAIVLCNVQEIQRCKNRFPSIHIALLEFATVAPQSWAAIPVTLHIINNKLYLAILYHLHGIAVLAVRPPSPPYTHLSSPKVETSLTYQVTQVLFFSDLGRKIMGLFCISLLPPVFIFYSIFDIELNEWQITTLS